MERLNIGIVGRLIVLLAFILVGSSDTFGQNVVEQKDTIVYPTFPGGYKKWNEYIRLNLKYPADLKKWRVEGTVFVEFQVDSTGVIEPESIDVLKGLGVSSEKETIRLLKESPRWIPARSLTLNKNISAKVHLPIKFILEEK